jgi:hypothetical protein
MKAKTISVSHAQEESITIYQTYDFRDNLIGD